MAWAPILEPGTNAAVEAQDAVCAIAQALREDISPPGSTLHWRPLPHESALLFGYLALVGWDGDWRRLTAAHLNLAIEQASTGRPQLGLAGGLCGLGWTVEHLAATLDDSADAAKPDLNEDTDEVVMRALLRTERNSPYDLIGGLVGCGVYLRERMPRESAARSLRMVVAHLEKWAEYSGDGIAWYSGPELLPDGEREKYPGGYYNLGVAHGIPGILHFLSETRAAGIESERCARLLDGAMAWFLRHRRPPGSRSWYGDCLAGGKQNDSRLTWCYGDLGILAVLLQIARRTPNEHWRAFAAGLLDACLERSAKLAETGVKDAPLCHGAAGVAHIFNRIYQAGGDPRCRTAAVAWFERALAMRHAGQGVAEFPAFTMPHGSQDGPWKSNPAFVDGATGVALALLAALTPVDPAWDRMLLLSGRDF